MRNSRWPAQAGNCVVTNCARSVIRLNASALSDSSSLTLSVSSPSLPVPSKTFRALVDSGSTHCFVDAAFARANKLVLSSIPPVQLRLFDGVTTKYITQSVLLPVVFSTGECIDISCYVTPLDSASSLVLGFDWLTRYNPLVDWVLGSVTFRTVVLEDPTPLPTSSGPQVPPADALVSDPLPGIGPSTSISFVSADAFA